MSAGSLDDRPFADGPLADEAFEAELVGTEIGYRGRVWDIRRDTLRLGDGEPFVREYVDHSGAVEVLAEDADGRVLLIRQYRHPVRLRDWEIPAGLLDVAGEDPLDAAKRELAEEADLAAEEWVPLLDLRSSPGGSDERIHVFLARGVRPVASAFVREEEEAEIETRWVTLEELVEAILDRRISNGPLIAAALALSARRRAG